MRVQRGTGCYDPGAVQRALQDAAGNVDQARSAHMVCQHAAALLSQPLRAPGLGCLARPVCRLSPMRDVQAIEILIERQTSEALGRVVHISGATASASSTGAVASTQMGQTPIAKQVNTTDATTADVDHLADAEPQRRPPRNKPCPCGSGAKYKNCCAAVAAAALRRQQAAVEAGHEAGVRVDQMQTLYL